MIPNLGDGLKQAWVFRVTSYFKVSSSNCSACRPGMQASRNVTLLRALTLLASCPLLTAQLHSTAANILIRTHRRNVSLCS